MTITLNGTTGITTPDVNVTAQSSNIVTTGNITAVDATLSGGVYVGGTGAANYLDDYEEGTWTPTDSGGMTGFSAINGTYVKIGNLVHVRGAFSMTSVTTNVLLGSLPFSSANTYYSVVDNGFNISIAYRRVEASNIIQWNVNTTGGSQTINFTAWYQV